MRRLHVLGATIGLGLALIACASGPATVGTWLPQNPTVPNFGPSDRIEQMAENLYFVPGGGSNTAIFVHENGVMVVDTKVANNGQTIIDLVRRVTDKPITHIVNTHHHPDHAGSNAEFPATVEIVAHANAAALIAAAPSFQTEAGRVGVPDRTFTDRTTLLSGRDAVDLYYFGPAHTNGDTFIVFRDARVMHAGDAFSLMGGILVDRSAGGSALAVPQTITGAVNVPNVDRIITGHASVVTHDDLVAFRDLHTLMIAHARTERAAGRTAEQALASFSPPERYNTGWRWGQPSSAPSAAAPIGPTAGGRPTAPGGYFATIYAELQ